MQSKLVMTWALVLTASAAVSAFNVPLSSPTAAETQDFLVRRALDFASQMETSMLKGKAGAEHYTAVVGRQEEFPNGTQPDTVVALATSILDIGRETFSGTTWTIRPYLTDGCTYINAYADQNAEARDLCLETTPARLRIPTTEADAACLGVAVSLPQVLKDEIGCDELARQEGTSTSLLGSVVCGTGFSLRLYLENNLRPIIVGGFQSADCSGENLVPEAFDTFGDAPPELGIDLLWPGDLCLSFDIPRLFTALEELEQEVGEPILDGLPEFNPADISISANGVAFRGFGISNGRCYLEGALAVLNTPGGIAAVSIGGVALVGALVGGGIYMSKNGSSASSSYGLKSNRSSAPSESTYGGSRNSSSKTGSRASGGHKRSSRGASRR